VRWARLRHENNVWVATTTLVRRTERCLTSVPILEFTVGSS